MDDNRKPNRNTNLIMKNLGDETILYDPAQKAVHVLNPTAQIVWELCDGEHNIDDMEQALRSKFSVPADHDVKADILQTLETFAAKHMIEYG